MTRRATRVVLCDLDDTLFDHSGATRDALAHLHTRSAEFARWSLDEFDQRHRVVLESLHLEVLAGKWTIDHARIERFRRLLLEAGGDRAARDADALEQLSLGYRGAYETSWRLVPGALNLARAIKATETSFVIVTNNSTREQRLKVERGGLEPFVDLLITSEEFGASKPDPGIILHALERVGASADRAVMFGDSLATDIEGARRAGVRAVWLNRFGGVSPDASLAEVTSLDDPRLVGLLTA